MNEAEMQAVQAAQLQGLGGANFANGLSAQQYAACRESAQTIVENMMKLHQKEFAAWSWLRRAMEQLPPNKEEEAALWDVVCRARRERY